MWENQFLYQLLPHGKNQQTARRIRELSDFVHPATQGCLCFLLVYFYIEKHMITNK